MRQRWDGDFSRSDAQSGFRESPSPSWQRRRPALEGCYIFLKLGQGELLNVQSFGGGAMLLTLILDSAISKSS